jgi:hypothetical protein
MPLPTPSPTDQVGWRFNALGALFVTVMVFLFLGGGLAVTAWNKDTQGFNQLMETVKALVMVAAGYWIGSSNSSQNKDATIAAIAAPPAAPPEPPVGGFIPARPAP